MTKQDVLKFIKSHNLAVVATVSAENKPQASVLEFGELDDLTIIVDMFKTSRKYKNLQSNNEAALVIGWDDDKTVQINGTAHELTGEKLKRAQKSYFTKNPRAKKWTNNPDIAYFAIKPDWVRYTDVSKQPWLIEEFNLKTSHPLPNCQIRNLWQNRR